MRLPAGRPLEPFSSSVPLRSRGPVPQRAGLHPQPGCWPALLPSHFPRTRSKPELSLQMPPAPPKLHQIKTTLTWMWRDFNEKACCTRRMSSARLCERLGPDATARGTAGGRLPAVSRLGMTSRSPGQTHVFHMAAATLRPGVARGRSGPVLAPDSSGHDPDCRDGLLGGRRRARRSQPGREHLTGLHTRPKQKNIQGENKKMRRCGLIYKACVSRCVTAEQPGRASRGRRPRGPRFRWASQAWTLRGHARWLRREPRPRKPGCREPPRTQNSCFPLWE